jgi:epoxide hydrolase-like predicted phosphatase
VIQALISDFGGVLTTPLIHAFAKFQAGQGIPLESLGKAMGRAFEAHGSNPLHELERGELAEATFLGIISDALSEEVGRPIAMDGFTEEYFGHLDTNHDLLAYLRSLKEERGVRLAMLTNNVREWEPRWRAMLPVDELFEIVVDSAYVGMRKPEPEIYELTLSRLGLPGSACVFVDDIEVNIDAAREHGIVGVHFRSNEQAIEEIEAALDGA